MTAITIARIEQKPKKSFVHTTDGRKLGCFNDKIEKFGIEPNGSYEADIEMTDYGSLITKARRVAAGAPTPQNPSIEGASHSIGAQPPQHTPFRTPEQMFVQGIIEAYIANGRCPPEALGKTIAFIRKAWNEYYGDADHTLDQVA